MSTTMFLRKQKWFVLALVSLFLGIVYTVVFATGMVLYPMLHIEQWLLLRPITRADCVLHQWTRLGEVDITLVLACVLGIVCILLGYRKRVLPYLVLLFLLGAAVELVGKNTLPQTIPGTVQNGLNSLHCARIESQPRTVRYAVMLGAWWMAPPISQRGIDSARYNATAPLVFDDDTEHVYSYPSGHALRWTFLALVACWLSSRHVRRRLPRSILMLLAGLIAFGGGFAQFYIGYHFITDLLIGYLLGISAACCMIGLLACNYTSRMPKGAVESRETSVASID